MGLIWILIRSVRWSVVDKRSVSSCLVCRPVLWSVVSEGRARARAIVEIAAIAAVIRAVEIATVDCFLCSIFVNQDQVVFHGIRWVCDQAWNYNTSCFLLR